MRKHLLIIIACITVGAGVGACEGSNNPSDKLSQPRVSEDDPNWNCLTMGNRLCGPDWRPLTPDQVAVMESIDPTQDWAGCRLRIDGSESTMACPNGAVETYTASAR